MWLSTNSVEMEGCSAKVNVLLPGWLRWQGGRDGAMHPGQHLTVLNVMMYSKQVGKVIIENGCLPTKITKGRKHQRCKRG